MSFSGGLYLGQVSEPSLDSCINSGNVSVSISNFPTVNSNVNIFSSDGGTLSNASGGLNTYDVSLPSVIANSNLQCNITNFTPEAVSNTLLVQYCTVGNWYKVESLGNTIGAVWNAMGAIIGGESAPPIGRVFKALDYGNGSGTVSTIIYSQNTKDINLATCIASGNVSVLVNNDSAIAVNDSYLASLTYTGSNVNVFDGNLASVINTGNVSVLVNNDSAIAVNDSYLASLTYTGSNVNVFDGNLASTINAGNVSVLVNNASAITVNDSYLALLTYTGSNVNVFDGNLASVINSGNVSVLVNNASNIAVFDSATNTNLQTLIDQTLLNGGVFWNAATVANNAFSNVVDFSTKNAIIYSFFGNVAPVNVDNAIVLTAYFSGDGANFYKSDITISPLDPITFGPTSSDFCSSIACGAAYVKLKITGLTGNCVITAIVNHA
jgi:hypothetical protein